MLFILPKYYHKQQKFLSAKHQENLVFESLEIFFFFFFWYGNNYAKQQQGQITLTKFIMISMKLYYFK